MICITGAGGTVGSEVVTQLQSTGASFRVAHHSAAKAEAAMAMGIDAVTADYDEADTLYAAFRGCDRLFLLSPNVPQQTKLELDAVDAAKAAGVRRIVKLSVLAADQEAYSMAKVHRPVERAIEASGLAWTFLRPNSFMQNVATFMSQSIKEQGAFYTASGEAKISHVDVRDIAAVASRALTMPDHEGKAYTLTGPEALTFDELASALSSELGHQISHVNLPPANLQQAMLAEGIPEQLAERLMDLERYFRENRASHISNDIQRVTGREPRRFSDYLREAATVGTWSANDKEQ